MRLLKEQIYYPNHHRHHHHRHHHDHHRDHRHHCIINNLHYTPEGAMLNFGGVIIIAFIVSAKRLPPRPNRTLRPTKGRREPSEKPRFVQGHMKPKTTNLEEHAVRNKWAWREIRRTKKMCTVFPGQGLIWHPLVISGFLGLSRLPLFFSLIFFGRHPNCPLKYH